PIDVEPDLLIVNRLEHEVVSRGRLVAVTYGSDGAALFESGREVARALPPPGTPVDGTAARDAFAAAPLASPRQAPSPGEALRRACVAGALGATRLGAHPSLPAAHEVDAILAA